MRKKEEVLKKKWERKIERKNAKIKEKFYSETI